MMHQSVMLYPCWCAVNVNVNGTAVSGIDFPVKPMLLLCVDASDSM
jgi:hypothetical protein